MTGNQLQQPIDIGDTFNWNESGGIVKVINMYIDEDGITQVRVEDGDTTQTVTATDLIRVLQTGNLRRLEDELK